MFAKSGSIFKSFSKVIVSMFLLLAIGAENFHDFYIVEFKQWAIIQKMFLEAKSLLFYVVYIFVENICQCSSQ